MKRTVLYLLFVLLLINCGSQPQTLSELNSEYVTIDDSVRVHYKLWNESAGSDAKTICFVHGFGCDMNTWEKQFEAFRDTKDLQLVFIDLPGYGQSDKPHVEYTLDFFAHAIAKVYVDNYDRYLKDVFPQAKKDMEERQNQLSQHMKDHSFVKNWERVTGYTWNRGDYHWLLYRAGAKGPSYNNLNENTNTVYYNQYLDYQLAMFSHEFGIFLMQDSIDPIVEKMKVFIKSRAEDKLALTMPRQEKTRMESKEYVRTLNSTKDLTYVPWSTFESLACWYNCKIAGGETEDYRNFGNADVKTFCQIFDRLSATGITDPAELYRKGIMEYLK